MPGFACLKRISVVVMLGLSAASVAQAQQFGQTHSAILTIDSERLYVDSAFGKRVAADIEKDSATLAAENRKIEAELTEEEQALTDQRADMAPESFRQLADAFDAKVQGIRRQQDAKARALVQRGEQARGRFFQTARPILAEVMRDTRAGVILERSSVFLSANTTDVTSLAIGRIDAALGDGRPRPED
ncbi:MAG: OmpH family outer membrane protein [Sedimentitalea sp.]